MGLITPEVLRAGAAKRERRERYERIAANEASDCQDQNGKR
jgi:hypothetical protein